MGFEVETAQDALNACAKKLTAGMHAEELPKARAAVAQNLANAAAATKAKSDEARVSWEKLLKIHPELPVVSISAVLCRTEDYRKWALHQIEIDKKYARIGGTINLRKRNNLQEILKLLDEKKAAAIAALGARSHAKPLPCSTPTVRALSGCVVPPTLLDDQGGELPKDPEQACRYTGSHADWYVSEDPGAPSSGWYLGTDWFGSGTPGDAEE